MSDQSMPPRPPGGQAPQTTQDQIQGFYHSALRAVTGYNYLTRKWLPLKGPDFYALVQVLRSHCFYDARTGEQRQECFPTALTLANECGISRRTIFRLLADPDMDRFVKRIRRRRYDADLQREVTTSNLYFVALDDPPIPEEDHLVAQKVRELETIFLAQAATQRFAERDTPPDASECQSDTLSAVPGRHSQSSARMARERSTLKNGPLTKEVHRSGTERARPQTPPPVPEPTSPHIAIAYTATGNAEVDTPSAHPSPIYAPRRATQSGNPDRIGSSQSRKHAQTPPGGVGSVDAPSQERLAWERAMEEADEAGGGTFYSLLREFGDLQPGLSTRIILQAFVAQSTPPERLVDLAYLARGRVRRFQFRGGHIANPVGYYINTCRTLANEAPRYGWDVEAMEKRDLVKHTRALAKSDPRNRSGR